MLHRFNSRGQSFSTCQRQKASEHTCWSGSLWTIGSNYIATDGQGRVLCSAQVGMLLSNVVTGSRTDDCVGTTHVLGDWTRIIDVLFKVNNRKHTEVVFVQNQPEAESCVSDRQLNEIRIRTKQRQQKKGYCTFNLVECKVKQEIVWMGCPLFKFTHNLPGWKILQMKM